MKTIFQHIEHVKGKPHHVRKQVAFGAATAGTALIALVWLAGSLGTGSFALKATSFADNTGEGTLTVSNDDGSNTTSGIAGVGAAAALESASAPRIEIIDSVASATSSKKAEQTTIPF